MEKLALVLGGGGAKGAYQVGIWQGIRELGIEPDIITGTSIGALNGALMVQGDYDRSRELWDSIAYNHVFAGEPNPVVERINSRVELFAGGLSELVGGTVDITPFEALIYSYANEGALRASPVQFGMTTVEVPLLKPCELSRDQIPSGRMADYLLASASCFPVFPPRLIDGHYYIDGGYHDDIPISLALRLGATSVVAVDLQSVGMKKAVHATDIPITYIRTEWDLGALFYFGQDRVQRNIRLGYLDIMKALGRIEGRLYAFERGELRRNYQLLRTFALTERGREGVYLGRFLRFVPSLAAPDMMPGVAPIMGLTRRSLDAMESAGRIFGLAPDVLYTSESFNEALIKRVKAAGPSAGQRLWARFFTDETPHMQSAIDILDPAQRVLVLVDIFRHNHLPTIERLFNNTLVVTAEFSAAYYIHVLQGHKEYSKERLE